MDYNTIEFEIKESVGIIRLNRQDVLNSFNYEMAKETQSALDHCEKDESIRAIIFTANGFVRFAEQCCFRNDNK